ncbi:pancreatic triacylglycerol lipase-like [Littorina saxatilis]
MMLCPLVLLTWCASALLVIEARSVRNHTGPAFVHHVEKRSSVCYGDLGCFSNNAPFHSLQRPVSFLPESPTKINPRFMLYTRQARTSGHRLHSGDAAGLKSSTFRANRPTKFLVHGFIDNTLLGSWMQKMTKEFLTHGDYNVVIVDWGFGSLALYGQATANTRVVGAMIAQLITFMQTTTGAKPEDMHIIGHSLGSHVAGYAGEKLRYLGRITGMDPAEPYFQNTDKVVRLDPSDALFVDVIHTDAASFYSPDLGLGMNQACGHVDFYVNGGHDQPGCEQGPISQLAQHGLLEGTREFVACNHMRAYHLFSESINSKCPFEGYRCASEDDFNSGKCLACSGEECGYLGMHADRVKPHRTPATNKYYLKTGSRSPFCRYHYEVALTISNSHYSREERGDMYARVTGRAGRIEEVKLTKDTMYIKPAKTYTFLLTSQVELGDVHDVNFRWVHDSSFLDIGSWNPFNIRHPTLYIDKVKVDSGEAKKTVTFCMHGAAVETGKTMMIAGKC